MLKKQQAQLPISNSGEQWFTDAEKLVAPKLTSKEWKAPICLPEIRHDIRLCREIEQLDQARRLHECAWVLSERGYSESAGKYLNYIRRELAEGEIKKKKILPGGMGSGTGENYIVTFKGRVKAVFKPEASNHDAKAEVAAYKLDQLLGTNLVPMTLLRTLDGKVGSIQYFVRGTENGMKNLTKGKGLKIEFLDALMGNVDRHRGNWLYTVPAKLGDFEYKGGRRVAIDHNRAFKYDEMGEKAGRLPRGSSDAFLKVEKEFYEGLKAATPGKITTEMEGLLSEKQINQLIQTRERILRVLCERRPKLLDCKK